jgi:hypothetical protein
MFVEFEDEYLNQFDKHKSCMHGQTRRISLDHCVLVTGHLERVPGLLFG